jgi:hypothetical protein
MCSCFTLLRLVNSLPVVSPGWLRGQKLGPRNTIAFDRITDTSLSGYLPSYPVLLLVCAPASLMQLDYLSLPIDDIKILRTMRPTSLSRPSLLDPFISYFRNESNDLFVKYYRPIARCHWPLVIFRVWGSGSVIFSTVQKVLGRGLWILAMAVFSSTYRLPLN